MNRTSPTQEPVQREASRGTRTSARSRTGMIAAGLALMTLAWPAVGGEIYRQIDSNGRVTYSDRPTSTTASKLEIKNRATDQAALAAQKERLSKEKSQRELARSKAADNAANQRDIQAQRTANCEKARAHQQSLQTSHRLYEVDANGERHYYSSAEQDAALEKARTQIEEWCNN